MLWHAIKSYEYTVNNISLVHVIIHVKHVLPCDISKEIWIYFHDKQKNAPVRPCWNFPRCFSPMPLFDSESSRSNPRSWQQRRSFSFVGALTALENFRRPPNQQTTPSIAIVWTRKPMTYLGWTIPMCWTANGCCIPNSFGKAFDPWLFAFKSPYAGGGGDVQPNLDFFRRCSY